MRIPNFLSEDGCIEFKSTIGKQISPRVGEIVTEKADKFIASNARQVLDVACGPGTVSLNLAKKYPDIHVTGIDSSSAMIKQCMDIVDRDSLKNASFITMNVDSIQFPKNSFDLIVCNLAFPFFAYPTDSMRGILDILNPGGTALFSVPGRNTWKEFFEIGGELFGGTPIFAKPFFAMFDKANALPEVMEEVGYVDVNVSHHLLPFKFDSGAELLNFFQSLFSLLNYIPDEIKASVTDIITTRYPNGFTMHYEAVTVIGNRSK